MPVRAKRLEFAVDLDRAGALAAEGCPPLGLPDEWTAEHLVLAGLARCSVTSLRHHARRAEIAVEASASAAGLVTKRESDGRYAFVELECRIDAELRPPPAGTVLSELLAKAERDCFIGASLTVPVQYRWRVNGEDVRELTSAA